MCCGKMIKLPSKEERMKRMITTRDVEAPRLDSRKRLKYTSTKEVDASPLAIKPEDIKPSGPSISTTTIGDIQEEAQRRKRAEIIAQRKKIEEAKLSPSEFDAEDDRGFNMTYVVVEIDDLLQGISRRELK